ncbi:hypothetical protein GCM10010277_15660 [Streptomyces longisporoflavus]|uniref:hypothetical protein n=1 Tax=Streptomyces longisporoflavus TaxID=28044 RepID=UPI00167C9C39|nr:hypothetical protein [Streptomyces longisporoflavus]GGV31746.1 hypothetical protein GCM10010277_15660 [Streptomyces longisporoflavus]
MRRGSLTLRGIAGAAVLAAFPVTVTAPAYAHEQDKVHATVTPSSAAAGADVEISVTGCDGTTGSAGSGAFEGDAKLTGRDGDKYALNGSAKIRGGVSGSYDVTVVCDGHPHQGVGTVRVVQHRTEPVSPVRAGGGGAARDGTAQLAAQAEEAGPGTWHAVIGLVLAGVAAVAVAFRSVRRRRSE